MFIGPDFPKPLADGLIATLNKGIAERIAQLGKFRGRIAAAGTQDSAAGSAFCSAWSRLEALLTNLMQYEGVQKLRDQFLDIIDQGMTQYGKNYLAVIKALDAEQAGLGSRWLQGIVDHVTEAVS